MKKKVLIVVEDGRVSEIYESHPDIEVEVIDLDCNDYEEKADRLKYLDKAIEELSGGKE